MTLSTYVSDTDYRHRSLIISFLPPQVAQSTHLHNIIREYLLFISAYLKQRMCLTVRTIKYPVLARCTHVKRGSGLFVIFLQCTSQNTGFVSLAAEIQVASVGICWASVWSWRAVPVCCDLSHTAENSTSLSHHLQTMLDQKNPRINSVNVSLPLLLSLRPLSTLTTSRSLSCFTASLYILQFLRLLTSSPADECFM
jgi:hypothetical protein